MTWFHVLKQCDQTLFVGPNEHVHANDQKRLPQKRGKEQEWGIAWHSTLHSLHDLHLYLHIPPISVLPLSPATTSSHTQLTTAIHVCHHRSTRNNTGSLSQQHTQKLLSWHKRPLQMTILSRRFNQHSGGTSTINITSTHNSWYHGNWIIVDPKHKLVVEPPSFLNLCVCVWVSVGLCGLLSRRLVLTSWIDCQMCPDSVCWVGSWADLPALDGVLTSASAANSAPAPCPCPYRHIVRVACFDLNYVVIVCFNATL